MKAHELFAAISPTVVTDMLDWFRANDRNVYKSALASLAQQRKLRPVFVERKSLKDQYAWFQKTLAIKTCNSVAEHLLQGYLMAGQQPMLAACCDGLGIEHDGKGTVSGDLPEALDSAKLDATVDQLVKSFNPHLVTLYLYCFNMQVAGGWPELTAKLENDERLTFA